MPHVIVKLWPGKSERQKSHLATRIASAATEVLQCDDESVSVGFEEVSAHDWAEKVYRPYIEKCATKLYKRPGYRMET